MGKDVIIKLLQEQLNMANATITQMAASMKSMETGYMKALSDLRQTVSDLRQTIANLETLIKERDDSLVQAAVRMRGLKATFLPKQSEKQTIQPDLKTGGDAATEELKRREAVKARGNNGARRKEHFTIETMEEDIYPENIDLDSCVEIGVRDVIRYEMIPMSFIKHVYHIHTLKKDDIVFSGKTPLAPLQNSSFDGSFIAGIAELRYLYSMPVERIVKYFRNYGFDIDKPTAHGLLAKTAGLFENLYNVMHDAVREDGYLNCDETYHTVMVKAAENGGKGSRKGYIWVIVAAHSGLVYFFYDDGSRSEAVILEELKGYNGVIQSDGLGAYKKVALQSEGKIVRVSCLQHCKRGFLDDSLKDNPDAKAVAELANSLYQNEHRHRICDEWSVEDNLKWRQEYAPPILGNLKSKLTEIRDNRTKYPPKSLMYKAANYFLNEWDGIVAISNFGDVSWDNNLCERTNRYISLSRHNSLFFGSHEGVQRGCFYYSLACSCRNNGVNFFEYLSDVLNKAAALPPGAPVKAYRNLLPDKWKEEKIK